VLGQSTNAQAAESPTLDEIIARALTAYGGKDSLAKIAQRSITRGEQTFVSAPSQSIVFRACLKGDKWRLDMDNATGDSSSPTGEGGANNADQTAPSGTQGAAHRTVAFDGRNAWQVKEKETNLRADELELFQLLETKQPFLLSNYGDHGYQFNLLGPVKYGQSLCFAVEVICPGDSVKTILYIDQANYLVAGLSYEPRTARGEGPVSAAKGHRINVDYALYRPVSGILWPFKQTQSIDGNEYSTTTLKSLDLVSEVSDSLFSKPGSAAVAHLAHDITVPFDYAQREIVVKGRLNGSEELEFLLDTGASDTLVDRRVAAEHFLAKEGRFDIAAINGVVVADTSNLKRLEVGKLIANDVNVRIVDLSAQSKHLGRQIAGIIGMNLIGRYLVTLDYSKPAIIFADADEAPRPSGKPVTFTREEAPFVKAQLSGKETCSFLVDTGAAFNHLPEATARHFTTGDTAGKHFIEGTGLDGQPVRLGTVQLDSVVIGGFAARKISFTYAARSESASKETQGARLNTGFFQDSSSGILGNPFWQNFVLTIDWKYQRLFLKPNPVFNARDAIQRALSAGDAAITLHRNYRDAEYGYQKALMVADSTNDLKEKARVLGRLGNLYRIMAKDLKRPEHAKSSYDYFTKASDILQHLKAPEIEGRVLADWSLLYGDNGQQQEARQTIDRAILLAPDDPNVNVDYAVHLYRAGLFPDMQRYVEKALFLDPDNWQALWYQVKLSENFNDSPKVVSTLKEIIRYYPWSNVAKDKLASILASLGQSSAAGATGKQPLSTFTSGKPRQAPVKTISAPADKPVK
jgi:predicted aspartyl protease/tetratricopeptide (TPR) repeat protein